MQFKPMKSSSFSPEYNCPLRRTTPPALPSLQVSAFFSLWVRHSLTAAGLPLYLLLPFPPFLCPLYPAHSILPTLHPQRPKSHQVRASLRKTYLLYFKHTGGGVENYRTFPISPCQALNFTHFLISRPHSRDSPTF